MERIPVVPYEGAEKYLFVSYSHKDTARVAPILCRLANEGYRIWFDEGIDPGSEWPENIAEHLGGAAVCLGLISRNYLRSDNCRREMNFALKRQIPYLSVLLEEVELTAGVEMQLSANQAIYKYKLPSDEMFYQKITASKLLQPARALPAAPQEAAAPVAPTQQPPVRQKIAPSGGKSWKKPALIALAAVLVVCLAVAAILLFSAKGDAPDTATGAPGEAPSTAAPAPDSTEAVTESAAPSEDTVPSEDTEPPATDSTDPIAEPQAGLPVNSDSLLTDSPHAGRILWGKKTQTTLTDKDTFLQKMSYIDVPLEDGTWNLAVLPYAIELRPDENPEILLLYCYDKLGTEYLLQGGYAIRDHVLQVTPCDRFYKDAMPLADTLSFEISFKENAVLLGTEGFYRPVEYRCETAVLCGAADEAAYQNVAAIDTPQLAEGTNCTLYFSDGGQTVDAKVENLYSLIAKVHLRWTQEQRPYNGTVATFDATGKCAFGYLNTYPYGFLLLDDTDVYCYQSPLPAD